MRAFIAIELTTEIKDALSKIQDSLKARLPKVSWIKPLNLHLTLKFLGEISAEQLNEIKQIITEIAKTTSCFKIKLEALGVFPNLDAAHIIWIGANQPPLELQQLARQLETNLIKSGIPQEQRSFCAHITIGRIKSHLAHSDSRKSPSAITLGGFRSGARKCFMLSCAIKKAFDRIEKEVAEANLELECKGITLFESTLGQQEATYTALKKASFKIT